MADRLPDFSKVQDAIAARMPAIADRAADLVREQAPIGQNTPERTGGALRDSIRGEAAGMSVRVTSDVEHAGFVIHGTAPHEIVPVNARALRFWVDGSNIVFAKRVMHPGTQPNDFPGKADGSIRDMVREELTNAIREALAT